MNKRSRYRSPSPKRGPTTHYVSTDDHLDEILNDEFIPNNDRIVYWPYEAQPEDENELHPVSVRKYRRRYNINITPIN